MTLSATFCSNSSQPLKSMSGELEDALVALITYTEHIGECHGELVPTILDVRALNALRSVYKAALIRPFDKPAKRRAGKVVKLVTAGQAPRPAAPLHAIG